MDCVFIAEAGSSPVATAGSYGRVLRAVAGRRRRNRKARDHEGVRADSRLVSRFRSRTTLQRNPIRTSESTDTSNPLLLVWLRFRSPQYELAAAMLRTSEPPH